MTDKRFVKYDGNTIVDLKLVKSWIISNGNVDLLLETLNNEKDIDEPIKRMTAKRYSDGTLAKWYYSQTNVISDGDNEYYLRNKESIKDFDYNELLGTNDLLDELNRLSDENEQLHEENQILRDENEHGVEFVNKVWDSIVSMNNRDLTDVERVFFNNLIKEMGIDLE